MKKFVLQCLLTTVFFFAACSEDSTEVVVEKMNVVESETDLPECESENEGDQAMVKGKSSILVCVDGDWFVTAGEKTETVSGDSVEEAVQIDSLVGYSQKGPFLKGSMVYLYELSDGRTLKQTNGNFTSNITSDDGRYKFTSRNLVSQYALVVVNGKYRNEVTGKPTTTAIQLQAYTNVLMRRSANVNLLTHLEHNRVYNLVVKEKLNMRQAKRQAQAEIMSEFYIDTAGFVGSSEDWDVFGSTDADAALLAISILLQGDSNETALSVLLTEISDDIAADGLWNAAGADSVKTRIADWAMAADSAGRYTKFRKNVEGWKLSKTVPDFEKYMRHFWATTYGIGDCTKKREGEIVATENENSAVYGTTTRFICKSGAWKVAEDIVVDTRSWKDGSDGKLKKGDVTDRFYKFDKKLGKWLYATENDSTTGLKGCTTKLEGSIGRSPEDDRFYTCENLDWVEVTETIAYDTLGLVCSKSVLNTIVSGVVNDLNKYYCSTQGWTSLMDWDWTVPKEFRLNPEIKYGSMTDPRDNKVYKTVVIGKGEMAQTWMAENLNYADSVATPSLKGRNWCYDDVESNCDVGGRLYNWAAAIDSVKYATDKENPMTCGFAGFCEFSGDVQGVCPPGWHLPSIEEFYDFTAIIDADSLGKVLKAQSGWGYFENTGKMESGSGSDDVGFTGLPAGMRPFTGDYVYGGSFTGFWLSTNKTSLDGYFFGMFNEESGFELLNYLEKNFALSVRCIKDKVSDKE